RPVVLVCERESAAVAALSLAKLAPSLQGLVLIGAGAITPNALERLGDCSVRFATLHGYPGGQSLLRILQVVAKQKAEGGVDRDYAQLSQDEAAWTFGIRSLVEPIRTFVRPFGER
ncbi:MAG: hypothetical protein KDC98_13385, partial [Planctomycetes bacterium]|nr:hypothetical protein [Planctomycetota bacterium]